MCRRNTFPVIWFRKRLYLQFDNKNLIWESSPTAQRAMPNRFSQFLFSIEKFALLKLNFVRFSLPVFRWSIYFTTCITWVIGTTTLHYIVSEYLLLHLLVSSLCCIWTVPLVRLTESQTTFSVPPSTSSQPWLGRRGSIPCMRLCSVGRSEIKIEKERVNVTAPGYNCRFFKSPSCPLVNPNFHIFSSVKCLFSQGLFVEVTDSNGQSYLF